MSHRFLKVVSKILFCFNTVLGLVPRCSCTLMYTALSGRVLPCLKAKSLFLRRLLVLLIAPVLVSALFCQPILALEALPTHLWLEKAQKGDKEAQYQLGMAFYQGNGILKNHENAANWLMRAAEQGHTDAAFCLATLYENGQGIKQSPAKAVEWYEKAAEQGSIKAQSNLGILYYEGYGVPQNLDKAIFWLNKAAMAGEAKAQYRLGYAFLEGKGVEKNETTAGFWLEKSAAQGNDQAKQLLSILK